MVGCGTDERVIDRRTGPQGEQGDKGGTGDAGTGCKVTAVEDGAIVQCGDDPIVFVPNGKDGVDGTNGTNGEDGEDFTPELETEWTGFYTLPNGGYLELLQLDDGRVQIYGTQRVYSVNFDAELALHPNLQSGPHQLKASGSIFGEYTASYSSANNDLEVDGSTTNISGSRKTVYHLYFADVSGEDKLHIHYIVYDSNGLLVEADRTVVAE